MTAGPFPGQPGYENAPGAAASFAAAYAALHASHEVADHWLQTGHQAAAKGLPGWPGRRACAAHVATYTAAQALALALTARVTGARLAPARTAAALAVSAVSHYAADRRAPLRALAELLEAPMGKGSFYRLGAPRGGRDDNACLGTGAYALDKAWHTGWLLAAALVAAPSPERRTAS